MPEDLVAIYALCEPDTGEVRYIGKADDPDTRLRQHLWNNTVSASSHKSRWLAGLKRVGATPTMRVIEWVPREQWEDAERSWIKRMRETGCRLTNMHPGGGGPPAGLTRSVSTREKIAAVHRGRKRPPETCARISAKARERQHVPPPPMRGEANPRAKLTEALVIELRRYARSGGYIAGWAVDHGVTPTAARLAAIGQTWKSVDEPAVTGHVRKPPPSDEDIFEMKRQADAGVSQRQIGQRMGLSQQRVCSLLQQYTRQQAPTGKASTDGH